MSCTTTLTVTDCDVTVQPLNTEVIVKVQDCTTQVIVPYCAPSVPAASTVTVWTTATRPTPAGGEYPWGFNTTTGKHEGWNGTIWNAFY